MILDHFWENVWAMADLSISKRLLVARVANTHASHLNWNFLSITVSKIPRIKQKQNTDRLVIFLKSWRVVIPAKYYTTLTHINMGGADS
jgi:hypothetical protein